MRAPVSRTALRFALLGPSFLLFSVLGLILAVYQFSFHTHFAGHGGNLVGKYGQGIDHLVYRIRKLGQFAQCVDRQFFLQVSFGHGRYHFGDAPHLAGKV